MIRDFQRYSLLDLHLTTDQLFKVKWSFFFAVIIGEKKSTILYVRV